jgi:hypothetical protein
MKDQCCFHIVEIAMLKIMIVVGCFLRVFLLHRYLKPSIIFVACKSRKGMVDLSLDQILRRTHTYFQNRFFTGHNRSM